MREAKNQSHNDAEEPTEHQEERNQQGQSQGSFAGICQDHEPDHDVENPHEEVNEEPAPSSLTPKGMNAFEHTADDQQPTKKHHGDDGHRHRSSQGNRSEDQQGYPQRQKPSPVLLQRRNAERRQLARWEFQEIYTVM